MASDLIHDGFTMESATSPAPSDELRELDQHIAAAIELRQHVSATGARMRKLLQLTQYVIGDLKLAEVLRRTLESACLVAQARRGVLVLLRPDGTDIEYLHEGVTSEGPYPDGAGHDHPQRDGVARARSLVAAARQARVLCAWAEDRGNRPISQEPAQPASVATGSGGVAALAVPIRVRGEAYAELYVFADSEPWFYRLDEDLLTALAETAGVAIDNARLFEESRARQQWLQASAEITSELLQESSEPALELIVRRTLEVADSDLVMVMLRDATGARLEGVLGIDSDGNRLTDEGVPIEGSTHGLVMRHARPLRISDSSQLLFKDRADSFGRQYPQIMMLPLVDARGARGVLTVCRTDAARPYSDADLQMATSFAGHAALALELSDARRDLERVLLLEDRDRIARDLHDHVIARLFATGLELERNAAEVGSAGSADSTGPADRGDAAARLLARVGDIDDTIREIRTSIFQLRGDRGSTGEAAQPGGDDVVSLLKAIAAESDEPLGFAPVLRFRGTPETISAEVADNLAAVLREALANVLRHARATRVDVEVEADSEWVAIMVRDNGIGLGRRARNSGLENLRQRALRRGGEFMASSAAGPGSAVGPGSVIAAGDGPRDGRPAGLGEGLRDRAEPGTTLIWRVPAAGRREV